MLYDELTLERDGYDDRGFQYHIELGTFRAWCSFKDIDGFLFLSNHMLVEYDIGDENEEILHVNRFSYCTHGS